MSTAVAPGMAHGFRGVEKGKQQADTEEPQRNRGVGGGDGNGLYDDEEEEDEGAGRGEIRELEEALSEGSSIGAASSDSSSIGEDSSSEKEEEDGDEVESKVKPPVEEVFGMGLGTLESLEDALPNNGSYTDRGKSKKAGSPSSTLAHGDSQVLPTRAPPTNQRHQVAMALRTGATSSSGRGGCHERKGRGRGGGATSPRRAPTLSSIPAVRFPHRARLPPPASQPRAPPTAGRLQARSRPPPAASQPRLPTPSSTPAGRLPRSAPLSGMNPAKMARRRPDATGHGAPTESPLSLSQNQSGVVHTYAGRRFRRGAGGILGRAVDAGGSSIGRPGLEEVNWYSRASTF